MWLGIAALACALSALSFCVYLYIHTHDNVSEKDISSALQRSSEELSKTSEKSFRALEAEWVDMYSKFMRLAGRIDKTKGIDAVKSEPVPVVPQPFLRRSDLIRKRNGGNHHVEDVSTQ